MIKNLITNWKTTSAGVTMMVGGLVHLAFAIKNHALTESDCTTTLLAVVTGAGFIAAGDAANTTGGGGPTPPQKPPEGGMEKTN